MTGGLETRSDLEENGALADPRLAAHQDHRAGHHAAAEHEVELVDAGAQAVELGALHVAQARRWHHTAALAVRLRSRLASRCPHALASRRLGRGHLLNECVPLAAGVALPGPPQRLGAALRAPVDRLGLQRHGFSAMGSAPWVQRHARVASVTLTPPGGRTSSRIACAACGNASSRTPWGRCAACR